MSFAIQVENLSKRYRVRAASAAGYRTLREDLSLAAQAPLRWWRGERHAAKEDFWALQDVSFEVQPGEVVGVIGRNGAGKSTLLKILSRITKPTSGRVRMRGRVGSLLEVGTGFHPELTGRENIYLSGAILGMSRSEVARKFDEIVAFAEIERFLDTPVKRYSSGMYVRLAFSVAAHLEPDILIIDEVLAVGDAQFQKKCLGKIGEAADIGRTVLLVSHNLSSLRAFCSHGVFLEQGKIAVTGTVDHAVRAYHGSTNGTEDRLHKKWLASQGPGTDQFHILEVQVRPLRGDVVDVSSGFRLELLVHCREAMTNVDVTFELRTIEEILVLHEGLGFIDDNPQNGTFHISFEVPPHVLNSGRYQLSVFFGRNQFYPLSPLIDLLSFCIEHSATQKMASPRPGIVRPQLLKAFKRVDASTLEERVAILH